MRAIVSGQAGLTVLIDADIVSAVRIDAPGKRLPCRWTDIPHLFADATDVVELEETTSDGAVEELRRLWRKDRALQFMLILLEPGETTAARQVAAESLEVALSNFEIGEFVADRLYIAPLPPSADLVGARQLVISKRSLVSEFLLELNQHQSSIRHAREAWNNLGLEQFGGIREKRRFQEAAASAGVFRFLAKSAQNRRSVEESEFLPYLKDSELGRLPNALHILMKWAAPPVETVWREHENMTLREVIDEKSMFEEIVGTSRALHTVISRVSQVARTDSVVLLTGETGTGKELVARAIHRLSKRANRAFVAVNCPAIPHTLIASELFGHEQGAFTGATVRRLGRFELAEGGTILIDEVGDLPIEDQGALLRVLQENQFERVGGTHSIRADVRVIAATNRDLSELTAAGAFRTDLFYRLNVFPIEIPPLRERSEDIPLLVEYFVVRYAKRAGKNIKAIDKKTLDLFQSYSWPGNIRELQNVVERSVILCETEILSVDTNWFSYKPVDLSQELAAYEKKMIEAALSVSRGQVSSAAARLSTRRSTLESKIRSLKINKDRFKTAEPIENN